MTWTFDKGVAEVFRQHAQQHIPHYLTVIQKTVDICSYLLPKDAAIIDVGCAIGETVSTLAYNGFTNLYGVDSSQSMLDKCNPLIATYTCSTAFPAQQKYNAVLCNWTLHFIKDKSEYLAEMCRSIVPGGFLVLSDKTSTDPLPTEFYYQFKRSRGITEEQIQAKRKELDGVMFIDDVEWYLQQFKTLNAKKTYVIDSDFCFTTFLVIF